MASYGITITLVLSLLTSAICKIYDRCELARELRDVHEIPSNQIATWVCLARHESEYNTAAVNHGSGDHGLFQLSQLYWCSPPGYACGISCNDLHDDDIEDDMICARRVYREHQRLSGDGFNAWVVYQQYCKDKRYSEKMIEGCFTGSPTNAVRNITDLPAPDYFPQFRSRTKPITKFSTAVPITKVGSFFTDEVKIGYNNQGTKTVYHLQKSTPNLVRTTSIGTRYTSPVKLGYNKQVTKTVYNTQKNIQSKETPKITYYQPSTTFNTQKTSHQYQFKTTKHPWTVAKPTIFKAQTPTKAYSFTAGVNSAKTTGFTHTNSKSSNSRDYTYSINNSGFRFERTSL